MNIIQRASATTSVLVLAVALFGCSPEPAKAKYTVDEYLANPAAMDAKLEECANNPGDLSNDPDCMNVKGAAERKGVGSLRDLPPMGLVPPEKNGSADQTRPNSGN